MPAGGDHARATPPNAIDGGAAGGEYPAVEQVIAGAGDQAAALTSLATILFTSVSSLRAHDTQGAVRWDIVRPLAPGILVGSLVGAQIAGALPTAVLALLFALAVGGGRSLG